MPPAVKGGSSVTLSRSSSASTPPAPSTSTSPNCGSARMPTSTSATPSVTISSTSSIGASADSRARAGGRLRGAAHVEYHATDIRLVLECGAGRLDDHGKAECGGRFRGVVVRSGEPRARHLHPVGR